MESWKMLMMLLKTFVLMQEKWLQINILKEEEEISIIGWQEFSCSKKLWKVCLWGKNISSALNYYSSLCVLDIALFTNYDWCRKYDNEEVLLCMYYYSSLLIIYSLLCIARNL